MRNHGTRQNIFYCWCGSCFFRRGASDLRHLFGQTDGNDTGVFQVFSKRKLVDHPSQSKKPSAHRPCLREDARCWNTRRSPYTTCLLAYTCGPVSRHPSKYAMVSAELGEVVMDRVALHVTLSRTTSYGQGTNKEGEAKRKRNQLSCCKKGREGRKRRMTRGERSSLRVTFAAGRRWNNNNIRNPTSKVGQVYQKQLDAS